MPLPNPRTQKFRGIIKELNSGSNNPPKKEEKASEDNLMKASEQNTLCPSNSTTNVQIQQYFRNRKSSCSSCNSSHRDFSPASDEDRTYKPSLHDNSSSSESDNVAQKLTLRKNEKPVPKHEIELGSSKSHTFTTTSKSSSSSEPNSSSSSGCSSSSDSDSDSSDSEQKSATPSKINCVTAKPCEMIEQKHLNNPRSLKSMALEQTKIVRQIYITIPEALCQNDSNGISRKRKRGNKKDVSKTLRNMGLQYTSSSSKHKLISERKIGNPCGNGCRLKCSSNISEDERMIVFQNYWKMGSLTKQREFISKHITEVKPKYQYKRECNNRKPKHAFYLTFQKQKKRVCKIFFKRTLGINDRPIRTVIEKLNTSGIIEPELRGKHNNHGTKVSEDEMLTQNEGDSVHSTIERQIKRRLRSGPIYVPDQYIDAIRDAKKKGKKYNVVEMSHTEFYNIKKLQEYKLTKNTEGNTVKIGDIRFIKIEKSDVIDNVRVLYKTSYMDESYREIKLLTIRHALPQLLPLYASKLPLPDNKKKDLNDLIKKNAILPYYVSSFYNQIL